MSRVLVLFAHPAIQRSIANRALLDAISDVDGVTFHDLYETYPDLLIDVEAEQDLLARHDTIVFQHPFYWYAAPAIIKEWMDVVLEHGYAYGENGRALQGKSWMHAITTGGGAQAYTREGRNHFTIAELLRPFEASARLCRCNWLEPFVVHASHLVGGEMLSEAGAAYRARLKALVAAPQPTVA